MNELHWLTIAFGVLFMALGGSMYIFKRKITRDEMGFYGALCFAIFCLGLVLIALVAFDVFGKAFSLAAGIERTVRLL